MRIGSMDNMEITVDNFAGGGGLRAFHAADMQTGCY